MQKVIEEIQKWVLFGLVQNERYIYTQMQKGVLDRNGFNGIKKPKLTRPITYIPI